MYLSLLMMTDSMVLKHEFFMSTVLYHFILPNNSPLQFQIVHFALNIFPPPNQTVAMFIPYF